MNIITAKKIVLFTLASTLIPIRLYSAHMLAPLTGVTEEEGRASFARLASERLWQKDTLNCLLFLKNMERHYVVLDIARKNGQDYLPDGIENLILSYSTCEKSYPRSEFKKFRKTAKIIERDFLGGIYIGKGKFPPPSVHGKIQVAQKATVMNPPNAPIHAEFYRLDDVLRYLLQGKEFERESCWSILCCFCCDWNCGKNVSNRDLRTYEEVTTAEEGWKDEHFVMIERILQLYTSSNVWSNSELFDDEQFRQATAFYMESYYDTCMAPLYPSTSSSVLID